MESSEANLEANITIPVTTDNQVRIYNFNTPDLIAVDEYIAVLMGEAYVFYDEGGAGVVAYTSEIGTLNAVDTGLNGSFDYDQTRTGWIYLHDGSQFWKCQVKQFKSNETVSFTANGATSILEVLQKIALSVQVDYFYSEDLLFLKTNSVQTSIEGFDYGEANTPNINIGTDGTTIITSYEISVTDSGELTPPEEIGITLTIRKNNSGGTEIYSGTASSSSASIIPVGRTLTPSDIGTANKIWVSVELAIVEP